MTEEVNMFEKEAESYATQECCMTCNNVNHFCKEKCECWTFAKKGAEFGYNKANEWHYVKDGIMPEENQWVLVYDGSYTVCNYHSNTPIKWLDNYENEVPENAIIAWKKIVPPNV
jgi:hypothetical protein